MSRHTLCIRLVSGLLSGLLFFAGLSALCIAAESVRVVGSFGSKGVLEIDGRRRVLSVNELSPEGVQLLEINSDYAILKIDGKAGRYEVGASAISTKFKPSESTVVNVYQDTSGMFRAVGSINGHSVNFLVDTGATTIAMNSVQAMRMGLDYKKTGQAIMISTASGATTGYLLKLNTVSIAEIKLQNIDAVVIEGNSPSEVLLGMSFLGRLNVQHQGSVMTLRVVQ